MNILYFINTTWTTLCNRYINRTSKFETFCHNKMLEKKGGCPNCFYGKIKDIDKSKLGNIFSINNVKARFNPKSGTFLILIGEKLIK